MDNFPQSFITMRPTSACAIFNCSYCTQWFNTSWINNFFKTTAIIRWASHWITTFCAQSNDCLYNKI